MKDKSVHRGDHSRAWWPLVAVITFSIWSSRCAGSPDGLYFGSRPSINAQTGDLIVSVRQDGNGRIQRVSQTGVREFLTNDGDSFDPKISSDGKHIVFAKATKENGSDIWITDSSGRFPRQLTNVEGRSAYPVVRHSTNSVVFARGSRLRDTSMGGTMWVDWDLYEVPESGGAERRITNSSLRRVFSVDVTPDGISGLISSEQLESDRHLSMVDLSSGEMRPIGVPGDDVASVGLQSGRVTFVRDSGDYNYEVFVMQRDGSSRQQLTSLKSYTWAPVFSPDERRIFFLSDPSRNSRFKLWEVIVDSKASRELPF
jgi:Tol biopolymer transport system component